MTELEALDIRIELWEWLVKNFPAKKKDYPDNESARAFRNKCSLCELFWDVNATCPACCLGRCQEYSKFDAWAGYVYENNGSANQALQAAKDMLETMKIRKEELEDGQN